MTNTPAAEPETPWQRHEGALAGIRVLDLTRILSGPFSTMILSDLGADVIKVEDTAGGDDTRHWGPPYHGDDAAYYHSVNRNKRSLAVDLKSEDGRALVRRLALSADVVVENFRPGHTHRPAHRLGDRVVAGVLAHRAGMPIPADRAVDQSRVQGAQLVVTQA